MGVWGGLRGGELTGEDFWGEVDVDFVAFLKNREADLLGSGRCGGEVWRSADMWLTRGETVGKASVSGG